MGRSDDEDGEEDGGGRDGEEGEEEYDFEYSDADDEGEEEGAVLLENAYYQAKGLKTDDPHGALDSFQSCIAMEEQKGEWGFKATKQSLKLLFLTGQFDEMLSMYGGLLEYAQGAVSHNRAEKGINGILDCVQGSRNWNLLEQMYAKTLDTLQTYKNEGLWFKTNLRLGRLYFAMKDIPRLLKVLKELVKFVEEKQANSLKNQHEVGSDSGKRGSQLLEVYALLIQLYSYERDNKRLRETYQKALRVTSGGVAHPSTMAVILQCGGQMHMEAKEYDQACSAFFQAFKNYDEAGEPQRLQVLKYLVLASILHQTKIDPFDSQEARPYKSDPEIVSFMNLILAYQNDQIKEFEQTLRNHQDSIMSDPFIRQYIGDLLRTVRTQVVFKVVKPYRRISLAYLAEELNDIPTADVEQLLVSLILDGQLDGLIDQIQGVLWLGGYHGSGGGGGGSGPGADGIVVTDRRNGGVSRTDGGSGRGGSGGSDTHTAVTEWARELQRTRKAIMGKALTSHPL